MGQWLGSYPMEFKTVTLRYAPTLGIIDDAPLVALAREHELLALRDHFFVVHDVPHLLCLVSLQRKPTPVTTAATAPVASPAPPSPSASPSSPEPLPGDPTAGDPAGPDAASPTATLTSEQRRLYEAIRRWRYETAQRDGVPPYVVLTNRNLADLVRERPDGIAALRRVRGIGQAKVERHGEALLALLRGEPPPSGPPLVPEPTPQPEAASEP